MSKKSVVINERCPFGAGECERKKCEFKFHEAECNYYIGNQMPGKEISDQVPKEAMEFFDYDSEEPKGELIYIDIDKLYAHPDNPRKDLGDLTELTDSIKASGVLQNLTVVPKDEGTYTIIIGHRRCAAAKEAGLNQLPCIVADMSIEEQVATMMAENMHRSDLTLYEQAEGFQMMMNLGISEADITKRTGFSKSTVKRRLNLLKLDKEGFKKAEARGATLSDYIELDKIKDEKVRNEVLGKVGTSSFQWDLKSALDKQKRAECEVKILELVKAFAKERTTGIQKQVATKFVRTISFSEGEIRNFTVPNDVESNEYYYEKTSWSVYLYKKEEEGVQDAHKERLERETKRQLEQNEWQNTCREISERAYNLRLEFVKNYVLKPKDIELITLWAIKKIMTTEYYSFDTEIFEAVTGFKADKDTSDNFLDYESSILAEKKKDELLFRCVYCMIKDNPQNNYFAYYKGEYCENEELDELYSFLCAFGYEMSEEELALQNGTHEMFEKSDE